VSDELEATGAAGNGGDTTTSGRTAVATPLRPTGKRSRQVTEPVEAPPIEKAGDKKDGRKAKAKTAKKTGPDKGRRNPFAPVAFVWTYLKQVIAELRKVIWPNRKQMVNYTAVVLVFLVFMVALIFAVDFSLAAVVRGVFTGVWKLK
jgi:preprotein translocase subunit SecE